MKLSQLHSAQKGALYSFLALATIIGVSYRPPSVSYERDGVKQERNLEDVHGTRLSDTFVSCMDEVGVNLPVSRNGQFAAHHWDAGNVDKWNENIRFTVFEPALPEHPLILDIGGNTVAADSREFHKTLPGAEIHIYERVPAFVEELKRNWADLPEIAIHGRGLGVNTNSLHSYSGLGGTGFFCYGRGNETIGIKYRNGDCRCRG